MPALATSKLANTQYHPSYIPVAVFAGGTAGVGHAMAEALARYTSGRIHIILIGQNEAAATRILSGLTKSPGGDACKREFVKCNASEMKNVRKTCAELRARLERINHLVLSAGFNSTVWAGETKEGLDYHLSLRYYSRCVYIQELVTLLTAAADLGQDARVMTVLGGGLALPLVTKDINNSQARGGAYECLKGITASIAGIRAGTISAGYNDALVIWFAAQYPRLAFIHIHPGMVRTPEFNKGLNLGWALTPVAWAIQSLIDISVAVSQDECAEYMLYALLDPTHTRGVFLHQRHGDLVSGRVFDAVEEISSEERKVRLPRWIRGMSMNPCLTHAGLRQWRKDEGIWGFGCGGAHYM
ncbi:hypothetical protein B0H11DRAFT_430634 [Mycena galericulata]|nr:hypothetical protein B0H11DRAFT_430634 [Mycena galericulata]